MITSTCSSCFGKQIFQVFLLCVIVCLPPLVTIAQEDSLDVSHARWSTKKITRGVKWKHYWFNHLFSSNQNIDILEIRPVRKLRFAIAFEKKELKPTSDFGNKAGAVAAINGNFFDVKNGGSVDFLKVNNELISEDVLLPNGERARHQRAAIAIHDRRLTILTWDGSQDWEKQLPEETVMCTGPLLVWKNMPVEQDTSAFSRLRNPRSALAITKDGHVFLITVDGRNEKAAGMTLPELRSFLQWMHAEDAINFDGGGSTSLWIQGQPQNGIVNYPSDKKSWDHTGERRVANALLVMKKTHHH